LIKQLKRALFTLVVVCSCHSVVAQQISSIKSEQDLLNEVVRIQNDHSISPIAATTLLKKLVILAKKNQWEKGYLRTSIGVLKQYKEIEQIEKISPSLSALHEIASQLNDRFATVELDIISLYLVPYQDSNNLTSEYATRLLNAVPQLENVNLVGDVYLALGEYQYSLEKFEASVNYLKQAYEKFEMVNELGGLSRVLIALGNINIDLSNAESSLDFNMQALELAEANLDTFSQSIIHYNLHFVFMDLDDVDKAKLALENAIVLSLKIDDVLGVTHAKHRLADIFISEEQWGKAIPLLKETLTVFDNIDNAPIVFEILTSLTLAYLKTNDLDNAKQTLNAFERKLESFNDAFHKIAYQQLKANWLYLNQNHKNAFEMLRKSAPTQEQWYEEYQNNELEKLRVRFEVQLKENENEKLQSINQISQKVIKQQEEQKTVWMIVALLSFLVFVLLAFMLVWQVKNKQRFKQMAFVDQLTGSPNRRSIMAFAVKSIEHARHSDKQVMIALLDLDKFKSINDTFGHDIGDNVLKAFANALKENIYLPNYFGRFGGEEWLIILNESDKESPKKLFTSVREKLQNTAIEGIPDSRKLSFSMGVAIHRHASGMAIDETIQLADKHLYHAKNSGRDRISGETE
jgi:diguanylate cyclase (GGDEF)-like protein